MHYLIHKFSALCLIGLLGACTTNTPAPIEQRTFPTSSATRAPQAPPVVPTPQSVPGPTPTEPAVQTFGVGTGNTLPGTPMTETPATPTAPQPAATPTPTAPSSEISSSDMLAKSAPAPAVNARERRVAILLPTKAAAFEKAAKSVRAGIEAAAQRESSSGIRWTLEFIDTTEAPAEIAEAFTQAQISRADLVIGPLTRASVNAAAETAIARPTVLLNAPDNDAAPRGPVLAFALSLDAEARRLGQLAHDAALREGTHTQPHKPRALIVQTAQPLSKRIAQGFADAFTRAGGSVETQEVNLTTANQLINRAKSGFDVAFLATDAATARTARPFLPRELPIWGTSQINTGRETDLNDLHGVRFADMPWKLSTSHPAVMVYPREGSEVDDARLYAFGIDAFRLGVALVNGSNDITLDGVTGRLSARVGRAMRVEREAMPAMVKSGQIVNLQ